MAHESVPPEHPSVFSESSCPPEHDGLAPLLPRKEAPVSPSKQNVVCSSLKSPLPYHVSRVSRGRGGRPEPSDPRPWGFRKSVVGIVGLLVGKFAAHLGNCCLNLCFLLCPALGTAATGAISALVKALPDTTRHREKRGSCEVVRVGTGLEGWGRSTRGRDHRLP